MTNVTPLKQRKRKPQAEAASPPAGKPPNTPWSGNLRQDEVGKPGGLLLAALMAHADERGQSYGDMAVDLGVTYGYIAQLRSGLRKVMNISPAFSIACARYLGVPRLTVLLMAGALTHQDAYEDEELLAAEIPRAMKYIRDDPDWGTMVTPQIRDLDATSQFMVVRLYEVATSRQLLPKRLDIKELAKAVRQFGDVQERRRLAMEAHAATKGNQGEEVA